jgi:hypothetical protein
MSAATQGKRHRQDSSVVPLGQSGEDTAVERHPAAADVGTTRDPADLDGMGKDGLLPELVPERGHGTLSLRSCPKKRFLSPAGPGPGGSRRQPRQTAANWLRVREPNRPTADYERGLRHPDEAETYRGRNQPAGSPLGVDDLAHHNFDGVLKCRRQILH